MEGGTVAFTWIPWDQIGGTANLRRGDILLKIYDDDNAPGHTVFYLGNNRIVGARGSGLSRAEQISEHAYYYDYWDGVLRYNG